MSFTLLGDLTASTPLPLLGPHLPILLISTIGFFLIQNATHKLGPRVLGRKWEEYDKRTKHGFASHVVSMVHAVVIIPLALKALRSDILAKDPIFGYDPYVGHVLAISSGYFIWDTIDSLLHSTIGFVIHGACCLSVYLFSFRPFLAGFGPPFLLWELSTPLLNIHWFMDKMGLSTVLPTFFLLNALCFMLVFFLARIVYGGYESFAFFTAMWTDRHKIPLHLHLIYCLGNLALNALNWLWFSKMVKKMLARVTGDDKPSTREHRKTEKDPLLGKNGPVNNEEKEESETLSLPADPPSPMTSIHKLEEER